MIYTAMHDGCRAAGWERTTRRGLGVEKASMKWAAARAGVVALMMAMSGAVIAHDHADDDASRLTAQWWQWALSLPASTSPVTDETGAYCMLGQRGPVWFLAGSTTGRPTVRHCTVPEGVPLFFPVLNSVNVNTPGCFQEARDLTVKELRALVASFMDGATGLSALLNNRPVAGMRRIRSMPFIAVLPSSNLFGADCLVPGQPYAPGVDDGYYVELRGLDAGQHHLHIRGTGAGGFMVDVFYTLNVVSVQAKR